jgi:hypothetical protein
MSLSRKEILGLNDAKIVKVAVPEWNGDVYIKALSGEERAVYADKLNQLKRDVDKLSLILVTTLCDEAGKALFSHEDIPELNKRSSMVIDRLANESFKVNGLGVEAEEAAEKN